MSRRPYYRWFPGDYAADTGHLGMSEHGAYRQLLDHAYSTGGRPIPIEAAYRIARAASPAEQQTVDRILTEFWQEIDDGWIQPRVVRELALSRTRARAGRKGGSRTQAKLLDLLEQTGEQTGEPLAGARGPDPDPDPDRRSDPRARDGELVYEPEPGADVDEDPGGMPTMPPGGGTNSGPTARQLETIASLAEELGRADDVPTPRTKGEASRAIDELMDDATKKREARREHARVSGRVQGKWQHADDAAAEAAAVIRRRRGKR